jgi:uncharacterized protein (TIGR02646 family)
MRNIPKLPEPAVLSQNKSEWTAAFLSNPSETTQNRYRHPEIKAKLLTETNSKCVYCESKIGHNCAGDIEHKVPKAKRPELIMDWNNMTIACNECNRRKGQYYDPDCMFLDPNSDDVENLVQHVGPLVFNRPGDTRGEVTVRILELNLATRNSLIERKFEKLESIWNLCNQVAKECNPVLKNFLLKDLSEACDVSSEFSGMVKTYVEELPENWYPS